MIKEMMKSEKSFFKSVAEDLNRSAEKGQLHSNSVMNNQESGAVNNSNNPSNDETTLKIQVKPIDKALLKGEMQIKLISLRKLAIFWEASNLPKKLFELYFDMNFNELIHVIRIYDVSQINFNGSNANHFYEFSVTYEQAYWFVKGLLSNRSYIAEIGVKVDVDNYFPLFRSNAVQTPKFEITTQHAIYQEVFQLHQYEEKPPKWTEHVSTYSYYIKPEKDCRK